jgi:hypothetical protein
MNNYAITVEELERRHEVIDAISKSRHNYYHYHH